MADRFGRTPAQINADMATIARLSGYDQADPSNYSDALRQNAARMGMTPSEYVSWSRSQGSIQAAPAGPQLRERAWQGAARREGTQFADRVVGRPYRAEGGSLSLLDFAGGGALDLVDAVSRGRDASIGDAAMAALGVAEMSGAPLALSGARKAAAGAAAEVPSTKLTRSLREGLLDAPTLPAPRNEAEVMAKWILEMRAIGRAGDVTEEMMAAADPQYMFFNTPLPMDYESRMARADQYFPDTGYHATTADFQAFEPLMRGTATDAGWFGDADYFSPSSQYAERFVSFPAENPLVIPARLNRGNVYDWRAMEADRGGRGLGNNADAALQTRERLEREGFNSVEVSNPIIKADAPLSDELWSSMIMADPSIEMMGRENVSKSLQAGIPRKSLEDYYSAEMLNLLPTQRVIDEIAIFSPNQIRSRFARFDPEFRHLRNLSAGVGGAGLLSYGYPSEGY